MGLLDISFEDKQKLYKDIHDVIPDRKKNRSAPRMVPSDKPVAKDTFRDIVDIKSRAVRDPRFDDLSGKMVQRDFDKNFAFIAEKVQEELDEAREALKDLKAQDEPDQEQISFYKRRISDLSVQLANSTKRKGFEKFKDQVRKAEFDAVSQGKSAYYMTHHQLSKIYRQKQLEEIKESGQMDKYIEKKAKKHMGAAGAFGNHLKRK